MVSPSIDIQGSSTASLIRSRQIFRCRVQILSLGRARDTNFSENHVTIALLLGDGVSIGLDMQLVGPAVAGLGRLIISSRSYTRSNSTIHYLDFDAAGCPSDFAPSTPAPATGGRSAARFLNAIHQLNKDYRFLCINGHMDGCRHWV